MAGTMDKLIDLDNQDIADNLQQYPEMAPEEVCPHRAKESEYIGSGDTQHTCHSCGYSWVTHNSRYDL